MSYEKQGGRSLLDKKSNLHLDSWKNEMSEAVGSSSRELGIYNRREVMERLKNLYETISKMREFEFLQELKEISDDVGVYVVGGSVRDAVLRKPPKDIDLVTNRIQPVKLIDVLLKHGKAFLDRQSKTRLENIDSEEKLRLIKDFYGVIKFRPKDNSLPELIDIAFPRSDNYSGSGQSGILGIKRDMEPKADPTLNIADDLERRDFTINAMAINLIDGEIVDPFDGVEDIVKKKIRTVGNPEDRILKEDISRGFRALRFACVLNFEIEDGTKKAIKEIFRPADYSPEEIYQDKPEILRQVKQYEKEVRSQFGISEEPLPRCLQVFWDRVQEKPRMAVAKEVMSKEILKAIDANPRRFVELMDEVGGLEVILPELSHLKNLTQPREHHREGDSFKHTLKVLENLPTNAGLRLKLAALFHDLGKADTQKISENGKITFYGHEKISAEHVRAIGKRFRFSGKLINDTVWLVENHMFPITSDIDRIKSTKLEKMFLENEDIGKDLIALSRADILSSLSEKGDSDLTNINQLTTRIAKIKSLHIEKMKDATQFIKGRDLIELGLKPGPNFSRLLEEIREAQLDEKIKSKEEAIELAKKLIK